MLDIHRVFLYTNLMKNNIIQFEKYKQELKLKKKKIKYRKGKHIPYVAVFRIKNRCVQGWGKNKKDFLKDCVSMLKQMLDEYKPEYFLDCYKITKDVGKKADYKSIQKYAIKKTKEKYKL